MELLFLSILSGIIAGYIILARLKELDQILYGDEEEDIHDQA